MADRGLRFSEQLVDRLMEFKLTRGNIGWIGLELIILLCILGALIDLAFSPKDWNYFSPILMLVDLILTPFGTSLGGIDYKFPIIFRALANGVITTIYISVVSLICGFIVAAIFAVILVSKGSVFGLKYVVQSYVDFFRSTPLLVQILLVYFALPALIPGITSVFRQYEIVAGIIGLTLNTSAYQTEIIRSGILAIPIGQTEASRALGMTQRQTMRYVIVPQAIRLIVPPLTNESIQLILNSSLLSVIGVTELTKVTRSLQSTYFYWQVYLIAAIFYFVLAFSLAKVSARVEVRLRIPGLGVANE